MITIEIEKDKMPQYSCELAQLYLTEGYARKAVETLQHAKNEDPDDLEVTMAF